MYPEPASLAHLSSVYCLLVNRVQFLREQSYQAHHQTVNVTRALLCELVANRVLRRFDEDNPGPKGLLFLANILVAGFEPFQNCPDEVARANRHAVNGKSHRPKRYERKLTALEVAILSESKVFLASAACQRVVDAIYKGRIVYTPTSFIDIIPDRYKHKPVSLYDPKKSPLLNQYRLVVPRTRNLIEVWQFIILLVLYVTVMVRRDTLRQDFQITELIFCIYAFGWVLDQFASILEHGWQVYTQNLWSFLDVTFTAIYAVYVVLRIHGASTNSDHTSILAMDVLAMGAPVLVPRLAFNLMSENMLFVSLRAMMADFTLLSILAGWCFAGFLLSLKWLANDLHKSVTIGKWMLWVWFGLDGTGIQRSVEFHWLLGPVLMVTYAFLGNTLFLTILVSMLSNTFSNIVANAHSEIQFRRAVLTFEGVKSDAIFAYQPPFNILALVIMLPLKFFVTPRWFHKINVGAVRTINFPILLFLGFYERRNLWVTPRNTNLNSTNPGGNTRRSRWWDFSRFSVHGDIQACFESEPPQELLDELEDEDVLDPSIIEAQEQAGQQHHTPQNKRLSVGSANQQSTSPVRFRGSHGATRHESLIPSSLGGHGGHSQLAELIQELQPDVGKRLDALEKSNKRIEGLLKRLCENMLDEDSDESDDAGSRPPSRLGLGKKNPSTRRLKDDE